MRLLFVSLALFFSLLSLQSQLLIDDFEGNATIIEWVGDDCIIDASYQNPYMDAENPSTQVLRYQDNGGLYANVRFNAPEPINISEGHPFRLKIYVPSNGVSGQQPNQISLKLQNNQLRFRAF